jgi:hypothetical protein
VGGGDAEVSQRGGGAQAGGRRAHPERLPTAHAHAPPPARPPLCRWHATAYEPVSRLTALAAAAAAAGDGADAAVVDVLKSNPCRIDALVGCLLAAEAWREELLPGIAARLLLGGAASGGAGGEASSPQQQALLALYFPLFHEGEAANALQLLAYSEGFADALAARDCAVDVVDYAMRRVTALGAASHAHNALAPADRKRGVAASLKAAGVGATAGATGGGPLQQLLPPHGQLDPDTALALVLAVAELADERGVDADAAPGPACFDVAALAPRVAAFLDIYYGNSDSSVGGGEPPSPDSPPARLGKWAADCRFATGAACLSLLRFLSDRVGAGLPLGVLVRLLDTHDVPVGLVPLIHNPPGVRRRQQPQASGKLEGGDAGSGWEKWGAGGAWAPVAGPHDLLRLTPLEAAPWLTLHNLTADGGAVAHYRLTPGRKGALLRLRRYLTPGLVDQLPPLGGLQRYLDELALVAVPDGGAGSAASASRAGLLLQAVPAVREAVLAAGRTPPPGWQRRRQRQQEAVAQPVPEPAPSRSGGQADEAPSPAAGGEPGPATTATTTAPAAPSSSAASSALLGLEGRLAGGGLAPAGSGTGVGRSSDLAALLTVVKPTPLSAEPVPLLPAGGPRGLAAVSSCHGVGGVGDGSGSAGRWSWDEAAEWCAEQLLLGARAGAGSGGPAHLGDLGGGVATPMATTTTSAASEGATADDDDALLEALAGPPRCEVCGAAGPAVKRCARCRNAWYCGRGCQAAAWRAGHAALCDVVARHGSSSTAGGGGGGGPRR